MDTIWLHLNDEIPRIGSGHRRVQVRSKGWKWVHLVVPATGKVVRVSRKLWDRLQ